MLSKISPKILSGTATGCLWCYHQKRESYSALTFQYPKRLPPILSIRPFFSNEAVIRLTVRSDFPISSANFFWVSLPSFLSKPSTCISSKVTSKVPVWHFGESKVPFMCISQVSGFCVIGNQPLIAACPAISKRGKSDCFKLNVVFFGILFSKTTHRSKNSQFFAQSKRCVNNSCVFRNNNLL